MAQINTMADRSARNILLRLATIVVTFLLVTITYGILAFIIQLVASQLGRSNENSFGLFPVWFYCMLGVIWLAPGFVLYYVGLFVVGKKIDRRMKMLWGAVAIFLGLWMIQMVDWDIHTISFYTSLAAILILGASIPLVDKLVGARFKLHLQAD